MTTQLYGKHNTFRRNETTFCPHCGVLMSLDRTGIFTCRLCENGIKVVFSLEKLKVVASSTKGKRFI